MEVCNFIKKDTRHRCFLVSFADFLRTPFYRKLPDDFFLYIVTFDPHKCHKSENFFMLWRRTNASGLITKFLKLQRIVNAINLRKFKNLILRFEIEISSFYFFFSLFRQSSFFHLPFWLSLEQQRTDISNPSNISKIKIMK